MHNDVILNTVDFIAARFLENDGVLLTLYLLVHFYVVFAYFIQVCTYVSYNCECNYVHTYVCIYTYVNI